MKIPTTYIIWFALCDFFDRPIFHTLIVLAMFTGCLYLTCITISKHNPIPPVLTQSIPSFEIVAGDSAPLGTGGVF